MTLVKSVVHIEKNKNSKELLIVVKQEFHEIVTISNGHKMV